MVLWPMRETIYKAQLSEIKTKNTHLYWSILRYTYDPFTQSQNENPEQELPVRIHPLEINNSLINEPID